MLPSMKNPDAWSRSLRLLVVLGLPMGVPARAAAPDFLEVSPCAVQGTYEQYVAALAARPPALPRDKPFDPELFKRATPRVWFEALQRGRNVRCRKIAYAVDGQRVMGYLVEPTRAGRHPVVVFNRGGTQDLGRLRLADLVEFTGWALDGYVVVASQYRGNDGGEGREEWGGADVADVVELVELARRLPNVDPEAVFMYGFSRGGMMTYLALKHGVRVRAAATVGGVADLEQGLKHRPETEEVYRALMPDYDRRKAEHLKARSVTEWPAAIDTPLLLLHGGQDWRVSPSQSLALAARLQELGRPYELVIYAGEDHPLSRRWPEARARLRAFFREHLPVRADPQRVGSR